MKGLYFYKLISPYREDVTKNCKLTINEIDSNFLALKDEDIKSAELSVEDKMLVLTRNNDEKLFADLSDVTYNLDANVECNEGVYTLTIEYDGKDGKKTLVLENLATIDGVAKNAITKVVTDGTLRGDGTMSSPLGLKGTEKTGMLAPAKAVIDLTDGSRLPKKAKYGTRYVTIEKINDYGYLYNGYALDKISSNLEKEGTGWRVPTKEDWDKLLNAIEPCEYQNHDSAKCHTELGKVAGKYLKSECGWVWQPACECSSKKPVIGCKKETDDEFDFVEPEAKEFLKEKKHNPIGIDKYGMTILPAGKAELDVYGRVNADSFRGEAYFWTSTYVHGDDVQDRYVKVFKYNKGGVEQAAICPSVYFSVRLVKDYDGTNFHEIEYIDGVPYKTILLSQAGQIWLASNYARTEGFLGDEYKNPEFAYVNDREVDEERKTLFINEWNGEYWEKKELKEGDTIVIETPCSDKVTTRDIEYCWNEEDEDGETVQVCETFTTEVVPQAYTEYRVYNTDECEKELVNTDDLVIERVLDFVMQIVLKERKASEELSKELEEKLDQEIEDRKAADEALQEAIDQEIEDRTAADEALQEAIDQETEERKAEDELLWTAIETEEAERRAEDERIEAKIDDEIERAESEEQRIEKKLDEEIERSTEEDKILWEAIETEELERKAADAALQEAMDSEADRAQKKEAELEEKIDDEIERAKSEEERIEGLIIDAEEEYTFNVTNGAEPNLTLKSKDGNERHFVKIDFKADFGEI